MRRPRLEEEAEGARVKSTAGDAGEAEARSVEDEPFSRRVYFAFLATFLLVTGLLIWGSGAAGGGLGDLLGGLAYFTGACTLLSLAGVVAPGPTYRWAMRDKKK